MGEVEGLGLTVTARKVSAIAEACRAYLYAHQQRSPNYPFDTPREQEALLRLEAVIAAPEREAVTPHIGTAA